MRFLADDTLKRRLSYLASQPHPTTTCRHQSPVIVLGPNLTDHPRTLIPEEPPPPHMALQAMASVAAAAAPVMMEAAVRAEEEAVAGVVEVVDDKYYSLDNGLIVSITMITPVLAPFLGRRLRMRLIASGIF